MEYRKWIWIELIGFDNTQEDVGVGEYIDRLGFIPEAISLLIFSPDFVHQHSSESDEVVTFPLDYSSYNAHPFNAERDIQIWDSNKLKTLVDELHKHGVKVIPAVFSFFGGNIYHKEWLPDHMEVTEVWADGEKVPCINPLKRFVDGSFYEDFFFGKLMEVIDYYGFDGWHAADGWAHPRTPLWRSDYSDDMVGQFLAHTGVILPEGIRITVGEDIPALTARADYIYNSLRTQWCTFHAWRWGQFLGKATKMLHEKNLLIAANAAWTRDPFEALYRYGVDYALLRDADIDVLITESAAAASDMEARGGDRHHNYVTTMLLTGVHTPELPLVYLNGLKDVEEQWDVLRHTPAVLEKEIYSLSNVYRYDGDTYTRCAAGPLACLGDGLEKLEWKRLKGMWDLAFDSNPVDTSGPMLVWSPNYVEGHISEFAQDGLWSIHKLTFEISRRGAWITTVCSAEDLAESTRPVLLINPHELDTDTLNKVLQNAKGPLVAIGPDMSGLPDSDYEVIDAVCGRPLICRIYRPGATLMVPTLFGECKQDWDKDKQEPVNFLFELNFAPVSDEFLKICADVIKTVCKFPIVTEGVENITVRWFKLPNGAYRVALSNDSYSYVRATVELSFDISEVHVAGPFPIARIVPDGPRFTIKVPGKGLTVVDVTPK